MTQELYRYTFSPHVPLEEVEATLLLAIWGTESLHGESQVRLDAAHFLDAERRACVIDAGTPVGRDVNRLFVGFLRREFDADDFRVERVVDRSNRPSEEADSRRHSESAPGFAKGRTAAAGGS